MIRQFFLIPNTESGYTKLTVMIRRLLESGLLEFDHFL
jgi:hypothetical protein